MGSRLSSCWSAGLRNNIQWQNDLDNCLSCTAKNATVPERGTLVCNRLKGQIRWSSQKTQSCLWLLVQGKEIRSLWSQLERLCANTVHVDLKNYRVNMACQSGVSIHDWGRSVIRVPGEGTCFNLNHCGGCCCLGIVPRAKMLKMSAWLLHPNWWQDSTYRTQ